MLNHHDLNRSESTHDPTPNPLESALATSAFGDAGADPPPTQRRQALEQAANNQPRALQLKQMQKGATASPQVQKPLQRQANINAGRGIVQKRDVFSSRDGTTFAPSNTHLGKRNIAPKSSSKSIQHNSDNGLPTLLGVLKDYFNDDNINFTAFHSPLQKIPRPRTVMAEISTERYKDREDPITTQIGQLGSEEIALRERKGYENFYDGGHLIGAKILGPEAAQPYNIAPQEKRGNKPNYNCTIEQLIRGAEPGTRLTYQIDLNYVRNNYAIDQQSLVDMRVLKGLDNSAPWNIYVPSRIPSRWVARADITSHQSFGNLGASATARDSKANSTEVSNAVLDRNDEHKRSAFAFQGGGTKRISFDMKQYTPSDVPLQAPSGPVGTRDSLNNPANYEEAPPDRNHMLSNIPSRAVALSARAKEYQALLRRNKGFVSLSLPATVRNFNVPSNIHPQFRIQLQTKIDNVSSLLGTRERKAAALLGMIDPDALWAEAWRQQSNTWAAQQYRVESEHLSLTTSISSIFKELKRMLQYCERVDQQSKISSMTDGKLGQIWYQIGQFGKRLAMVSSTSPDKRYKELVTLTDNIRKINEGAGDIKQTAFLTTQMMIKGIQRAMSEMNKGTLTKVMKQLGIKDNGNSNEFRRRSSRRKNAAEKAAKEAMDTDSKDNDDNDETEVMDTDEKDDK